MQTPRAQRFVVAFGDKEESFDSYMDARRRFGDLRFAARQNPDHAGKLSLEDNGVVKEAFDASISPRDKKATKKKRKVVWVNIKCCSTTDTDILFSQATTANAKGKKTKARKNSDDVGTVDTLTAP
jgi:hypothetical protein